MRQPTSSVLNSLFPNQPLSEVCLQIAIAAERRGDREEAEEWLKRAEKEEGK